MQRSLQKSNHRCIFNPDSIMAGTNTFPVLLIPIQPNLLFFCCRLGMHITTPCVWRRFSQGQAVGDNRPCGNYLCQNSLPSSHLNECLAQTCCSVNWAYGMLWERSPLTINKLIIFMIVLILYHMIVLIKYHIPVRTAKWNGVNFNILFLSQTFNFFQNQTATGIWFSISQYIQCLYVLETESFLKP